MKYGCRLIAVRRSIKVGIREMYEFPGVMFHPWVGSHYDSSDNYFAFRLLVLGDSHYNSAPDDNYQDPDLTQKVVREWGQENEYKFFTVIANVLLGRNGGSRDEKNSEIWEHVAFYNYVSSYVLWRQGDDRPRRPTPEQWRASKAPFERVLQSLKPDAVLMLGKELSDCVVYQHNHGNLKMYHPYQYENIIFLGIYHPSSYGFPYNEAIPAFNELKTRKQDALRNQVFTFLRYRCSSSPEYAIRGSPGLPRPGIRLAVDRTCPMWWLAQSSSMAG